jgi:predicted DNA-binding transcriptional regulator YafY
VANTSSRTLQLLSLLQTHRFWPGTDLADRLGVSLRTLRRDVERLRELGYPVDAQRGVEGGYQLAPGASLPPLVLDDEEAVALAVGLLAAAQSPIAGTAEASVRALSKVIQVMPKRLRRRIDALGAMTEPAGWGPPVAGFDSDTLTTIAQSCRDSEHIDFGYVSADEVVSQRHVQPHRLVSLGRRWYLVAYDLERSDWRTFRLDRLSAPHPTGSRFAPRQLPADDAATFVRAGISQAPGSVTVAAVVMAPAAAVRSRTGRWATVEEETDASCTVRISTDSLDWAAFGLVSIGADFRVEEPPELVEHLRVWAEHLTRAAGRRAARP